MKKYKVVTKWEQWIVAESEEDAIETVGAGEYFEDEDFNQLKVIDTVDPTPKEIEEYHEARGEKFIEFNGQKFYYDQTNDGSRIWFNTDVSPTMAIEAFTVLEKVNEIEGNQCYYLRKEVMKS